MKTTLTLILSAGLAGTALAQTPPATVPAPAAAPAVVAPAAPAATSPAQVPPPAAVLPATPAPPKEPVKRVASETEKGLRLNFRGVPLELVLDYFAEAAGFIIVPKVDIRGRVDVWSNEPLTKNEAVDVLNNVLARSGYAAFRSDRTLQIINRDEIRQRPVPTNSGTEPERIPATENVVTQILPVKFISAEQLIKNLEMLLPTSATLTANVGANALIITDTQVNIRRVAEILKALDTPVASVSAIKVFPLKYADAKAFTTVLKDLFAPDTASSGGRGQPGGISPMQQMFSRFGGGGSPAGGSSSAGGGRVNTPKVVATADELSNSLVVSAPEAQMPIIEDLVKQVDVPVEDVTEVKVFRLKHANAEETAALIKNLFPDTTTQGSRGNTSRSGGFLGFRPPGTGGTSGGTSGSSERLLKQNRVVAAADNRTMSVIVTASPTLMEQITGMITQLDSDASKQQKVFVIPVENADPAQMQQILQSLFPTQNGRSAQMNNNNGRSGFGTGTTTRNNGGLSTGSGRSTTGTGRNSTGGTGFGTSGGGFGTSRQ